MVEPMDIHHLGSFTCLFVSPGTEIWPPLAHEQGVGSNGGFLSLAQISPGVAWKARWKPQTGYSKLGLAVWNHGFCSCLVILIIRFAVFLRSYLNWLSRAFTALNRPQISIWETGVNQEQARPGNLPWLRKLSKCIAFFPFKGSYLRKSESSACVPTHWIEPSAAKVHPKLKLTLGVFQVFEELLNRILSTTFPEKQS